MFIDLWKYSNIAVNNHLYLFTYYDSAIAIDI